MISMGTVLAECNHLTAQKKDIPEEYLDALLMLADERIEQAVQQLIDLELDPSFAVPQYSPRDVKALYVKLEADRKHNDVQLRTMLPSEPEDVHQTPSPETTPKDATDQAERRMETATLEALLVPEPTVLVQAQIVKETAQEVLQAANSAQGCFCCREFWDPSYVKPPKVYESASFISTNLPVRTWTAKDPYVAPQERYISITNIQAAYVW